MSTKYPRLLAFVAALLLFVAGRAASGHVFLDHAEPKVGAEVSAAPAEVKIWFSGDVDPKASSIEVLDSDGNRVDKKDCHADAKDTSLLIVSLPDLPPGRYTVVWKPVCENGHHTKGSFKFTVKAKG